MDIESYPSDPEVAGFITVSEETRVIFVAEEPRLFIVEEKRIFVAED